MIFMHNVANQDIKARDPTIYYNIKRKKPKNFLYNIIV